MVECRLGVGEWEEDSPKEDKFWDSESSLWQGRGLHLHSRASCVPASVVLLPTRQAHAWSPHSNPSTVVSTPAGSHPQVYRSGGRAGGGNSEAASSQALLVLTEFSGISSKASAGVGRNLGDGKFAPLCPPVGVTPDLAVGSH